MFVYLDPEWQGVLYPKKTWQKMYPKHYKDYPKDSPLKKQAIYPGKALKGAEMHELNGWGESYHKARPNERKGIFARLLNFLFSSGQS